MINVDVSFANALRRIMISEVPTVAIENVYMWNNSSIIHDEVLSHRIGLVPLNIDPRYFDLFESNDEESTDRNTVVFRLCVTCPRKKSEQKKERATAESEAAAEAGSDSVMGDEHADSAAEQAAEHFSMLKQNVMDVRGRPYTKNVYSSDLQWVPQGDQETRLPALEPIHKDILLAKLRPGQVIELEAHGRVGVGKDHAKYSPVATASYRLMPHVELVQPVYDELAEELDIYEPGVFEIVPCDENGHKSKAVVVNHYACTMSRNYMRNPYLKEAVKITRIPNHFIFNVEAVGMLPAAVIVAESLRVLKNKAEKLNSLLEDHLESAGLEEF